MRRRVWMGRGARFALLACACVAPSAQADNAGLQQQAKLAYFAGFDRDGDGRVGREEYLAYLSAGFDALDRNGNGRVDEDELPAGTRRSPTRERGAHQRAVLATFARLDGDRNGWLSVAELTAPPR